MTWYNHQSVQATLIGVLLGIGFVIPPLWPLGLLGIAYLCHNMSLQLYSWRQLWWVWFVKSLLMSVWIWDVYPIDWIGFDLGWIELPMIGLYWLTIAAAVALAGLGLYWSVRLWLRYFARQFLYAAFPLLWLLAELLGSLAFSIFLYGPGGSIGSTFSMGYVGYLLGEHGLLIQLAGIYGAYGLSVAYVALAVGGLVLYLKSKYVPLVLLVMSLLITSVIGVSSEQVSQDTLRVAVVDTTLPNEPPLAQLQTVQAAYMTAARAATPDYIILPEDSRLFDQSVGARALQAILAFTYNDINAVIVDSGRVDQADESYLQTAIYDGIEKKLYQSQKGYLVPQGEYLPYVYSWLLTFLGHGGSSKMLDERLAFRVGTQTSQAHFADTIPAVLFCFEVVDPQGVRSVLQERGGEVAFVAHILSHAWINHSPIFQQQLETMLRVQAIWNDTYIVSAANHAVGYTITPTGQIMYPEEYAMGEYWRVGVIEVLVR